MLYVSTLPSSSVSEDSLGQMQFVILIPCVYIIFVSKSKVKVHLEKKITFKVLPVGVSFRSLKYSIPQKTVLPMQRVLTLQLITSFSKIC